MRGIFAGGIYSAQDDCDGRARRITVHVLDAAGIFAQVLGELREQRM